MSWTFDKVVDQAAQPNGQILVRVAIVNSVTGEKRTEYVWFASSPSAAQKTAAAVKLLQMFADQDTANANVALRQTVLDRIDLAISRGATPAQIIAKIQEISGA